MPVLTANTKMPNQIWRPLKPRLATVVIIWVGWPVKSSSCFHRIVTCGDGKQFKSSIIRILRSVNFSVQFNWTNRL
jgi:hypothetical protein